MSEDLSTFDPALFLDQQVDTQFESNYTLLPVDDYKAMIEKVEARRTNEGQIILDIFWALLDVDELKAKLGLESAIVKQGIFLDYENGVLADGPNKNINLGQVRKALKQDKKGQPWSFRKLVGAGPATIHVIVKGDFNNVNRVA